MKEIWDTIGDKPPAWVWIPSPLAPKLRPKEFGWVLVADLGGLLKSEHRHMNNFFFSSFDNNSANSCGLADGQLKGQPQCVR